MSIAVVKDNAPGQYAILSAGKFVGGIAKHRNKSWMVRINGVYWRNNLPSKTGRSVIVFGTLKEASEFAQNQPYLAVLAEVNDALRMSRNA